jgi:hypothetical protein
MVRKDFYETRPDGVNLYRSYSDIGMMIRQDQTGAEYSEAIDIENSGYTYTETEIPVPEDELTDTEALNIIMGRDQDEPGNGDEVPEAD